LTRVFLGLGSNLGDREKFLEEAVNLLQKDEKIVVVETSSVVETDPVDYTQQPRFLNQIIIAETGLKVHELLKKCQQIETELGRVKLIDKGPRNIDIDILLYGEMIHESDELTIPHEGIVKRKFILDHLIELEPDLRDPVSKKRYSEVRENEFYKKH